MLKGGVVLGHPEVPLPGARNQADKPSKCNHNVRWRAKLGLPHEVARRASNRVREHAKQHGRPEDEDGE